MFMWIYWCNVWMNWKSLMKHCCLKKGFYSNRNMEVITDAGYNHAKKICKDFEVKILGKYHAVKTLKKYVS